jgi:hypothetical protein
MAYKIKTSKGHSYLGSWKDKKTAKEVLKIMKKDNPKGKYKIVRRKVI